MTAPLIKWVGSKRRLLPQLLPLLPPITGAYCEPFFGSGALYFELHETLAIRPLLGDTNPELINLYRMITLQQPREFVCADLIKLVAMHKADPAKTYVDTRRAFNEKLGAPTTRAAMFLYLNRTCFNGVWRVNSRGEYNVPMGDYKDPTIYQPKLIAGCAQALQHADIACNDYAMTVHNAVEETAGNLFVYLDPPYVPSSETANFTNYTKAGFGHEDFARLRTLCKFVDRAGGKFMLSNSNTAVVREAFKRFHITEITRGGSINSDPKKRAAVTELVIRNYL